MAGAARQTQRPFGLPVKRRKSHAAQKVGACAVPDDADVHCTASLRSACCSCVRARAVLVLRLAPALGNTEGVGKLRQVR